MCAQGREKEKDKVHLGKMLFCQWMKLFYSGKFVTSKGLKQQTVHTLTQERHRFVSFRALILSV